MTADGSIRPWRTIAQELARETGSKRILDLSDELTEAVQAQGLNVERAVLPISETLKPKSDA